MLKASILSLTDSKYPYKSYINFYISSIPPSFNFHQEYYTE